ncbi:hypothetical protein ACS0TY_014109 [Phlomoides rotata]
MGGNTRGMTQMGEFRDTITSLNLQDLGFKGNRFTWSNGHAGPDNIQSYLDRILATTEWYTLFPSYMAQKIKNPKPFRFEKMWLEHAQCKEIVERGWRTVEHNAPFLDLPKSCSENLKSWDSVVLGGIRKRIKLLKERIQKLQSLNPETHVLNSIKDYDEELDDLLKKEKIMWFQRSRALWLKKFKGSSCRIFSELDSHTLKSVLRDLCAAEYKCVNFESLLKILKPEATAQSFTAADFTFCE